MEDRVSLFICLLCVMFNSAEVRARPRCGAIRPHTCSEQSNQAGEWKLQEQLRRLFFFLLLATAADAIFRGQTLSWMKSPVPPVPKHSLLNEIRNLASKRSAHLSVWGSASAFQVETEASSSSFFSVSFWLYNHRAEWLSDTFHSGEPLTGPNGVPLRNWPGPPPHPFPTPSNSPPAPLLQIQGPSSEYIWTPHNPNGALAAVNEARQVAERGPGEADAKREASHRCCLCSDISLMTFPITETVICRKRLQTAGKGRMEQGNWWRAGGGITWDIIHITLQWEWCSISQAGGSFVFYSGLPQRSADADTTLSIAQEGE